jgi:hypothetical protein
VVQGKNVVKETAQRSADALRERLAIAFGNKAVFNVKLIEASALTRLGKNQHAVILTDNYKEARSLMEKSLGVLEPYAQASLSKVFKLGSAEGFAHENSAVANYATVRSSQTLVNNTVAHEAGHTLVRGTSADAEHGTGGVMSPQMFRDAHNREYDFTGDFVRLYLGQR